MDSSHLFIEFICCWYLPALFGHETTQLLYQDQGWPVLKSCWELWAMIFRGKGKNMVSRLCRLTEVFNFEFGEYVKSLYFQLLIHIRYINPWSFTIVYDALTIPMIALLYLTLLFLLNEDIEKMCWYNCRMCTWSVTIIYKEIFIECMLEDITYGWNYRITLLH